MLVARDKCEISFRNVVFLQQVVQEKLGSLRHVGDERQKLGAARSFFLEEMVILECLRIIAHDLVLQPILRVDITEVEGIWLVLSMLFLCTA